MDNKNKQKTAIALEYNPDEEAPKVIATGKGTKDEEMVLKKGDHVLYGKYAGTELEFDGEKLLIMKQADVLAILG